MKLKRILLIHFVCLLLCHLIFPLSIFALEDSKEVLKNHGIKPDSKYNSNLLVFTASYCSVCKAEEKRVETFKGLFSRYKIRVIYVYVDKLPKFSSDFMDQIVKIHDKEQYLEKIYAPEALPIGYLLNADLSPYLEKKFLGKTDFFSITPSAEGLFTEKNVKAIVERSSN